MKNLVLYIPFDNLIWEEFDIEKNYSNTVLTTNDIKSYINNTKTTDIKIHDKITTCTTRFGNGLYDLTKTLFTLVHNWIIADVQHLYGYDTIIHFVTKEENLRFIFEDRIPFDSIFFHNIISNDGAWDVHKFNLNYGFSGNLHTFIRFVSLYNYLDLFLDRPEFYNEEYHTNTNIIKSDLVIKNWMLQQSINYGFGGLIYGS